MIPYRVIYPWSIQLERSVKSGKRERQRERQRAREKTYGTSAYPSESEW